MSTLSLVKGGLNAIVVPNVPGSMPINPNDYRGGMWMFGNSGYDVFFSYNGHQSSLKAYTCCPPIPAIINKKAQAYINGKTWIINTQGKAKGKESTGDIASKVKKLLARPNPLQTWKQFEAQQYIYQQLFGYCILLPIKPVGFPNTDATSLWNIPPFMVDIQETNKLFYQSDANGIIKQIVLTYKDEKTILNASDIYIFKDFTPSFNSLIIPESRIQALEMPINNIIGAYESRNVLINYRGALGIISPDGKDAAGPVRLGDDNKEQLQSDFLRYGLKNNQWKFIISSASIKWSQMGVATRDLMLFEEVDDDIQRICDAYNYPYRLMSSQNTNSLGGSDVAEYKRLLYQDATVPEAENMYEQWNIFFGLDQYNLRMEKDYSSVPALQDEQINEAVARWRRNQGALIEFQNNLMTLNEWRELNGDDPLIEEWGNMYYFQLIQRGIVFASGMAGSSVPDTANTTANQSNPGA